MANLFNSSKKTINKPKLEGTIMAEVTKEEIDALNIPGSKEKDALNNPEKQPDKTVEEIHTTAPAKKPTETQVDKQSDILTEKQVGKKEPSPITKKTKVETKSADKEIAQPSLAALISIPEAKYTDKIRKNYNIRKETHTILKDFSNKRNLTKNAIVEEVVNIYLKERLIDSIKLDLGVRLLEIRFDDQKSESSKDMIQINLTPEYVELIEDELYSVNKKLKIKMNRGQLIDILLSDLFRRI